MNLIEINVTKEPFAIVAKSRSLAGGQPESIRENLDNAKSVTIEFISSGPVSIIPHI